MTDEPSPPEAATTARSYREGYYEGAVALLKGIGNDMAEEQKRVLESWVRGPLSAWRHGPDDAAPPALPAIDGA